MIPAFETYLRTNTDLSDEALQQITATTMTRTLQRNELLLQEGQICRHKTFIANGLLRTFGVREDGTEHIIQFSPEHSWTLDVESYDRQTPTSFNIAAIEKTDVLLWTKADFEYLLHTIPALKNLSQELISRNIYNSRQRIFTSISATPEEKYEDFIRTYPGLLQRLPLHMIASYLGISLKTLTRIRHTQVHK
ncbi:MAG: Crp/Fnr family transcriptional regulator [Filimonas sp.]|nr:Crp/Fnr family transcriptional regulator [Filimonas sp.]